MYMIYMIRTRRDMWQHTRACNDSSNFRRVSAMCSKFRPMHAICTFDPNVEPRERDDNASERTISVRAVIIGFILRKPYFAFNKKYICCVYALMLPTERLNISTRMIVRILRQPAASSTLRNKRLLRTHTQNSSQVFTLAWVNIPPPLNTSYCN